MAAGTWRLVLLVPAVLALVLLILAPMVIPAPRRMPSASASTYSGR
ncbi:hypothetical protein [Streptomyces sp. NPDC002588]